MPLPRLRAPATRGRLSSDSLRIVVSQALALSMQPGHESIRDHDDQDDLVGLKRQPDCQDLALVALRAGKQGRHEYRRRLRHKEPCGHGPSAHADTLDQVASTESVGLSVWRLELRRRLAEVPDLYGPAQATMGRSEEPTSELQSLMRISY